MFTLTTNDIANNNVIIKKATLPVGGLDGTFSLLFELLSTTKSSFFSNPPIFKYA